MKLSQFNYFLPKNLIANKPSSPRDACKLLIYDREHVRYTDDFFYNIDKYLQKGDVLVLNNTKVIPSRLYGYKSVTGGSVEVFLLQKSGKNIWQVLLKGKVKPECEIRFKGSTLKAFVIEKKNDIWHLRFNKTDKELKNICTRIGHAPIPPYISSKEKEVKIRKSYQTVYSKIEGSVATPTAGLHFTNRLIKKLKAKGIKVEYVTLHVGLGTFSPVRTENVLEHKMHPEYVQVDKNTLKRIVKAKKNKKRIIAVGTTVVRVLETVVAKNLNTNLSKIVKYNGNVNLFIYPGYKYKVVDVLITNFHLPKSTLLMLVSAFMGRKECLLLYEYAVLLNYKFYSFGDAMLII